MVKRNTKEIILWEALKLFSVSGYEGVSVRDIASAVGIKESSLYKHYKGKQEIFDSILEKVKEYYNDKFKEFNVPEGNEVASIYENVKMEELKNICRKIFIFSIKDPIAVQFRRMLTIEQYKNTMAEKVYKEFIFNQNIKYQTSIFNKMMEHGYFRKCDAEVMAMQFYGPVLILTNLYEDNCENIDEAIKLLDRHIEQFEKIYKK